MNATESHEEMRRGGGFHRRPAQKGMVYLSQYYRIARRSAPMWRVSPAACAKEVQQGFSPFIQKRPTFFCFPLHAKAPHFLLFSFPHKSAALSFVPLSTQKRRVRFDRCAAGLLYTRKERAKECNGTFFSPAACAKGHGVSFTILQNRAKKRAGAADFTNDLRKRMRQGFSPFIQKRPTFFCFPLHAKAPHFLLFSFPHKSAALSFVPLSTQKRRVRFDRCAAGLLYTRKERAKECNGTFFSPAACAKGHGVSFTILQNRAKKCAGAAGLTGSLCKRVRRIFFPVCTKLPHFLLLPAPHKTTALSPVSHAQHRT